MSDKTCKTCSMSCVCQGYTLPRYANGDCSTVCGDSIIDSDMEWNIFKALYISEKQQLQKFQATKKAVDNQYYNGCIGHIIIFTKIH